MEDERSEISNLKWISKLFWHPYVTSHFQQKNEPFYMPWFLIFWNNSKLKRKKWFSQRYITLTGIEPTYLLFMTVKLLLHNFFQWCFPQIVPFGMIPLTSTKWIWILFRQINAMCWLFRSSNKINWTKWLSQVVSLDLRLVLTTRRPAWKSTPFFRILAGKHSNSNDQQN